MNKDVLNNIGWWALSIALLVLAVYVGTESWFAAPFVLLAATLSNPYTSSRIKEKVPLISFLNLKTVGTLCCLFISVFVMSTHLSAIAEEKRVVAAKEELVRQNKVRFAAQQAAEKAELQRKENVRLEVKRREIALAELNKDKANILAQMDVAIAAVDESLAISLIQKYGDTADGDFLQKEQMFRAAQSVKKKAAEEAMLKAKNEKLAVEAEAQRQENYKTRIESYALDPYTSDQYPKTVKKYRSRLKELEKMRRRAAEMSIDSDKCDTVEEVQVSDERSSLRDMHVWVGCANKQRIYLSEKEIKDSAPVVTQSEKAWDTNDAMTACRELIKDNATIPSSVNIHFSGSDTYTSQEDGRVVITFNFDAKNEYGTEIGYTANCYFSPQRNGTIEISLRR